MGDRGQIVAVTAIAGGRDLDDFTELPSKDIQAVASDLPEGTSTKRGSLRRLVYSVEAQARPGVGCLQLADFRQERLPRRRLVLRVETVHESFHYHPLRCLRCCGQL